MAKITEQSSNVLVIRSFPKCIFGLCIVFLLLMFFASMFSEVEAEFKDYAIFIGVCLIFMAIQKLKITRLDKRKNEGEIVSKGIFGSSTQQFRLSDIENVSMVYGNGQYARGGAISLQIQAGLTTIVNSDICFGNRERNIRLTEEITQWI